MGSDKNNPEMDFSFLLSQGIHVILDEKSRVLTICKKNPVGVTIA